MAAGSPTRKGQRLSRERIVEAAGRAIEAEGYEAISLRSLAKRLEVTAPAIYDHVESKDDLLRAVAASGYVAMDAAFDVGGKRAIDRCRERALAYVRFSQDRPELFRVMFLYRPAAVPVEADNELSAASSMFDRGLADIVAAVEEGHLIDRDPIQINLTLWAAIHGVATVGLLAPGLADLVVDDVVDALFKGLAPAS
ncbi:MAG: TetR/AcrR family transcriptional regulator [Acidimicrobiales bacterium]